MGSGRLDAPQGTTAPSNRMRKWGSCQLPAWQVGCRRCSCQLPAAVALWRSRSGGTCAPHRSQSPHHFALLCQRIQRLFCRRLLHALCGQHVRYALRWIGRKCGVRRRRRRQQARLCCEHYCEAPARLHIVGPVGARQQFQDQRLRRHFGEFGLRPRSGSAWGLSRCERRSEAAVWSLACGEAWCGCGGTLGACQQAGRLEGISVQAVQRETNAWDEPSSSSCCLSCRCFPHRNEAAARVAFALQSC